MAFLWLYWILLASSCGYAAVRGGSSGRAGAIIMTSGSAASLLAALAPPSWTTPLYPVFWIDLLCLAAFLALALRSTCYWPIWTAAFQLIAVMIHVARIMAPSVAPKAYQAFQTFWSVPMLLAMAAGVWLDSSRA